MSLSNPARRQLMKLGHALKPVVMIGKEGVTDGVIKSARTSVLAHELIKIKINQNSDEARQEAFESLAYALGAQLVQVIGRTALIYKPHPEKPVIVLDAAN